MSDAQEILELRRELNQANYEYYVKDDPTMSDYDYDHKLRRLEELEGAHPELITPDSPTQRVGGKALESFTQVTHRVPLESLQDVFDFDELRAFDQRVRGVKRMLPSVTSWSGFSGFVISLFSFNTSQIRSALAILMVIMTKTMESIMRFIIMFMQ